MKEILRNALIAVISPGNIGTNVAGTGGGLVTAGATASGTFDMIGATHATILVRRGKSNGTAGAPHSVVVSLLESDDTNASNFATYVADKTLTANTSAAASLRYEIDAKGRKRYQKVTATPGSDGTNDQVVINVDALVQPEVGPTASAQLADTVVIIAGQGTLSN